MSLRTSVSRIALLALVAGIILAWREFDLTHAIALRPQNDQDPRTARPVASAPKAIAPSAITRESNAANGDLSTHALTALVATRLRDWEDDDTPERRDERTHDLQQLLASGGRTISDQLKIIEALPADLMDFAFGLPSFQEWMFAHPKTAAEWISTHPGISEARILTLFQDWGQNYREDLRLYLAQLPDGPWKQKAMAVASYEALSGNPVEAIAWARQLNPGGPQDGLLEIATTEWARRDAEAAGRWVSQVHDPALRERLTGSLVIGYADTAPELAAAWGVILLPPGKTQERSAAEVAGLWAKQDPAAAGAWVARFPAGEGRQLALGNLLNVWTNLDRDAALTWIRNLPDDTLRKEAASMAGLIVSDSESIAP